jgi:hypothetical protein
VTTTARAQACDNPARVLELVLTPRDHSVPLHRELDIMAHYRNTNTSDSTLREIEKNLADLRFGWGAYVRLSLVKLYAGMVSRNIFRFSEGEFHEGESGEKGEIVEVRIQEVAGSFR